MKDIHEPKQLRLDEIAQDIASKHYESSFTNLATLETWIYSAMQEAAHNATMLERNRSEQGFIKYLRHLESLNDVDKNGDSND